MLFSRREPLSPVEPSFTQRFSTKLGQYLTPTDPRDAKQSKKKTLNIDACYALLGEKTENSEYKLSDLQEQLEKLSQKYQKKTNTALAPEQLALAALKIDASKQAEILRHRFFDQDFSDCTLFSESSTSPLHLALLSDALNITTFSDTTSQASTSEFKASRHMLNVLLSDVSMQDLETYCRDLRESCSEAMTKRGADTESLQSSWQLRMRYSNSTNTLLLKCMPIDMLRDTFQMQYKEKFGSCSSNQDILVEALEVTVHCEDEVAPGIPTDSPYVEEFMQSWTPAATNSELSWSKAANSEIQGSDLNYLDCNVLGKLLASRVVENADSKVSQFFIQKV